MQGLPHPMGVSIIGKGGPLGGGGGGGSGPRVERLPLCDLLPRGEVVGCCLAAAVTLLTAEVALVEEEDVLAPWEPLDEDALCAVVSPLTDWPCAGVRRGWTLGAVLEDDRGCSWVEVELGPGTAADAEEDSVEALAARCCCPRDEAVLSPESVADVEGGTAEAPAVVVARAPCCLEGLDGAGCRVPDAAALRFLFRAANSCAPLPTGGKGIKVLKMNKPRPRDGCGAGVAGGSTPCGGGCATAGEGSPLEVGRTGRSRVDCANEGEEELASWPGALFTE